MTEQITSKIMYAQLMQRHYEEAHTARERGQLIAWSSSIAPPEFCETMGIHVLYPENHAAAIGAKRGSLPLLQYAEQKGYSLDICSYARINLAYTETLECNFENIPLPDVMICCNNICNTITKWYENIAKELKIPLIMFDMPFNHQTHVNTSRITYVKEQFLDAIIQLERVCKKPFDYDKFSEVMSISSKAAISWKKALDYTRFSPSPFNGFNIFNYMALIVCMRAKKESIEFFDLLAAEAEKLIKNKQSYFSGAERFRIMWEGIACWPYLSQNYECLKSNGINIVASVYPDLWALVYEPGNLDSMAEAYAGIMLNRNLASQIKKRKQILEDFHCDGAIYHMNRSCKIMDFMQYQIQREVHGDTGIPFVSFDGDQTDPRNFATAQFETRIQALVEMMEQKKDKVLKGGC